MHRLLPWALPLTCLALFFWNLGATPLIGLDEALYAETSREMAASGNYIVPTYNGEPFFDKPPLGYWLQAAGIEAFGVSPLSVRLPSAVAALALVFLTAFLGGRLFSRQAGMLAGFALATAIYTLPLARLCSLDQLFSLTITAALGSYLLAHLGIWPRWGWLGFWVAMGLSLLVKGPAGAVLILAVIGGHWLARRVASARNLPREAKTQARSPWLPHVIGLLLLILIAAPWYVLVQRETDGAFIQEFIVHQNLQRAAGKDFHHNSPLWFYLPIYLAGFFPWSVFVPVAWTRHVRLRPSDRRDSAALFAAVWVVAILVVFSAAKSKLPSYIYPAYPPSALLVGLMWSRMVERKAETALRGPSVAAFVVAGTLGAALIVGTRLLPKPIPGLEAALIPMGAFLVVGSLGSVVLVRRQRSVAAFAALCCGMAGFMLTAVLIGLPIAARDMANPAVALGQDIKRLARPGETVIAYALSPRLPSLPFYAERRILFAHEPGQLRSMAPKGTPALIVCQSEQARELGGTATLTDSTRRYVLLRQGR